MNRVLVEIVAQFAILLETAGESDLSLELAVRQQEELAFLLHKLSIEEREEFIRVLREVAETEAFQENGEILRRLPREVGLQDS